MRSEALPPPKPIEIRARSRRPVCWLLTLAAPLLLAAACSREAPAGVTTEMLLTEVAAEAGIQHRHVRPVLDPKLDPIMPWMSSVGAAAAAADFDNDGWIDLYVTQSRKGEPNLLYRNQGDGTFTDVAAQAGVADLNGPDGVSMDAVWGDFDNDGWADLYLVRWGRDALLRNNGDGTFSDVTAERFRRRDGSPGTDWKNGNAAVWLDLDLDGRLDLYVGNYFRDVDLWHLETTRIMHDSFETSRNGGLNQLFHQQADGTFVERAADAGVDDSGWTLAVGSADIDNDGWPDLYSADDFGPDQLYLNRGDGRFFNATGDTLGFDTRKGMNVDFGDFNNDGWLDIYVSNITTAEYLQEGNMLWHNNGPGPSGVLTLTDVALETGTWDGGWGWGAKFFDLDNDGDLDLAAGNGFISAGEGNFWYDLATFTVTDSDSADAARWPPIGDRSFSGYETLRLWVNDGLSFTERARELGAASDRDQRGLAIFDLDNDGDLDLYIATQNQPPLLYRNHGTGNHWLKVRLVGDPAAGTSRDAVGARVTVVVDGERQIRERDGGNGYAAQSDPRLHFGLGAAETVELLEVRWPDGGLQYLENVPVDQLVTVHQDPAAYTERLRIEVPTPQHREQRQETAPPVPQLTPEEIDRQLTEFEGELRRQRSGHLLASAYRARTATYQQWDRAIDFFSALSEEHPDDLSARLELAAALIDKIPACGGLATIVCKGTLARKALDQLDVVLEAKPDLWLALYSRGMNHLHWPRALRHSDDAVADFERAVEVQRKLGEGRGNPPAHFERVHVALGDAYAKAGRPEQARGAWRHGLQSFPRSEELRERLELADSELLGYVEAQRTLERPIDTDFSFLEAPEIVR